MPIDREIRLTVSGTDDAERRVRADLDRMAHAMSAAFPDMVSLALIGAFGRGEGAVVLTERGLEPWNDYDLLLVARTREGWGTLLDQAGRLASDLGVRGIDIVPFLPDELVVKASAMLVQDAREKHVIIWGDPTVFTQVPRVAVPAQEALIQLLNRMVCLLEAPPEHLTGTVPDPLLYASQVSKAIFAAVDSHLVQAGRYVTTYREKAATFGALPDVTENLKAAAEDALAFRLQPGAREWGPERWFLAKDEVLSQVGILLSQKGGSSAEHIAQKLWSTRFPGAWKRLRDFLRGRACRMDCRAVECAEVLILGAAKPHPDPVDWQLVEQAVQFIQKVEKSPSPGCWAEVAKRAVCLWFSTCHG